MLNASTLKTKSRLYAGKPCKPHPNLVTHTKNGHKRKGKRKTISDKRWLFRTLFWNPVREQLRLYVNAQKGNAAKLAKAIGVPNSQIHRYTCPLCEHDQEPTYSIGQAIFLFIATLQHTQKQMNK